MRGGELKTVVYLRNDRSNYFFLPMLYDTFFLAKKELAWMGEEGLAKKQRNRAERGMRRTAESERGKLKRQVIASEVEKVTTDHVVFPYANEGCTESVRGISWNVFDFLPPLLFYTIANSLV